MLQIADAVRSYVSKGTRSGTRTRNAHRDTSKRGMTAPPTLFTASGGTSLNGQAKNFNKTNNTMKTVETTVLLEIEVE